ncbi:DUF2213 domain-containing protein [Salmonella enterica]|nr:DUF2213 domain-containing protein [Salmonella enterica]
MKYFYTSRLGNTRYRLSDGSLLCESVPVARTGKQVYTEKDLEETRVIPDEDGEIVVNRSPDEVFSPTAMASFEAMSIVIDHPRDMQGNIVFIEPDNWRELAHGHVQNVRRGTGEQADLVLADLIFKSPEAIDAVDKGVTQISCGYDAKYRPVARGQAEQYNIVGNHIALVDDARAGDRCSVGDNNTMTTKQNGWLARLRRAVKTGDADTLQDLVDTAPSTLTNDDDSASGTQTLVLRVEGGTPSDTTTTADEDPPGNPIETRLAALETLVKSLVEKGTGDADPDTPIKQETTDADPDDDEDKKMTGDSAYRQDIISRGEMILPGFELPDGKKPGHFKRELLAAACKTADGKKLIEPIAGKDADFSAMPIATVDSIFNGASELARMHNNMISSAGVGQFNAVAAQSIEDLNKQAQDFWAKKGEK